MKVTKILVILLAGVSLSLSACNMNEDRSEAEQHKIVATSPKVKDVTIEEPYVCQIHAQKYIKVCAMANGYLDKIDINEGQTVQKDKVMFKIRPILYQAKWKTEVAEVRLAALELKYTDKLYRDKVVSENEVSLYQAKLAKAEAKRDLAKAELEFTDVKAPFTGIVDRLHMQLGSLVKEGEQLTTLSDTSVMWVYFNVPERRYLEYKRQGTGTQDSQRLKLPDSWIELKLADGTTFNKPSDEKLDTLTVEGKFNNETGNIAFRADFNNSDGLLRHGQTGTVVIHRALKNALVIPQRATYEILDKRYVYVVDKDNVVHQRGIVIHHEQDDVYVISSGLDANDRIVLEGVRQVQDGQQLEDVEFRKPEEVLKNLKHHAE
jgi:membrane fusion protein (multidrug efflux system)